MLYEAVASLPATYGHIHSLTSLEGFLQFQYSTSWNMSLGAADLLTIQPDELDCTKGEASWKQSHANPAQFKTNVHSQEKGWWEKGTETCLHLNIPEQAVAFDRQTMFQVDRTHACSDMKRSVYVTDARC